jgi:hypothetical protein
VWLGDRHQGLRAGIIWDRRGVPHSIPPLGGNLTELTEPCGALPCKCLFICLFTICQAHMIYDQCRDIIQTEGRARRTFTPPGVIRLPIATTLGQQAIQIV